MTTERYIHRDPSTVMRSLGVLFMLAALFTACVPNLRVQGPRTSLPQQYPMASADSSSGGAPWQQFYTDPYLRALIDSALANNQELNILLQEIEVSRAETRARKGEYLPFVDIAAAAGVEKVGEHTRNGAVEHNLPIAEEQAFPEPLPDLLLGARASWELDVWRRLRNGRKAAVMRYLATVEGRHFMVTQLVAELANSYFELLALDQQLEILRNNIAVQQEALDIMRMEKQAAKVTELAVRRFEAEVLQNRSLLFEVQQRIVETENRINFLVGRYPQPVRRDAILFNAGFPDALRTGLPARLLSLRPDVRRAELELEAARLDVKAARASFYPALRITAGAGLNAFNGAYFMETPASLIYNAAGDLVAPLINRNAIKAAYASANARQQQAVYEYERTLLNAYVEVVNQLSGIDNLAKSYGLRQQQVDALSSSITISNNLFRSARADYMEVLMTQRDALGSKVELVELRRQQLGAQVAMYQALGGGWR